MKKTDSPILTIPVLYAGRVATISWSAVAGADLYYLGRKINNETQFTGIFSSPELSFGDFIPQNAETAAYSIQASGGNDQTWDELEAKGRNWDAWDALGWQWQIYSPIAESGIQTVEPSSAPVISGQDMDLGEKYRGFTVSVSVTATDPSSTITLLAVLDSSVTLLDNPIAEQGAAYTISIPDSFILAQEDGSRHQIVITATDNNGETSTRILTFTALEDLAATATFYVLRDGIPVAKLTTERQWFEYLVVGTHRYMIRGIDKNDRVSDSNEITLTIIVSYATLALVSAPGDYAELIVRRGGRPGVTQNYSEQYTETRYEGREFPVYIHTGQRGNAMPLSFSTRILQEQSALLALIDRGEPMVYRDLYNSRVVGIVPGLDKEFQGRFLRHPFDAFIDFDITINQCDHSEEVEYD